MWQHLCSSFPLSLVELILQVCSVQWLSLVTSLWPVDCSTDFSITSSRLCKVSLGFPNASWVCLTSLMLHHVESICFSGWFKKWIYSFSPQSLKEHMYSYKKFYSRVLYLYWLLFTLIFSSFTLNANIIHVLQFSSVVFSAMHGVIYHTISLRTFLSPSEKSTYPLAVHSSRSRL